MRRLSFIALVLGLFALLGIGRYAGAQDATPAASPSLTGATTEEGVTFEPIAGGVAEVLPPAPAAIELFRIRLAPGGNFSEPDGDPGTGVILVESGELTLSVTRPATLTRADGTQEEMQANKEYLLKPGDNLLGPSGAGGAFSNHGSQDVVVMVAAVRPVAEPTASATPAA